MSRKPPQKKTNRNQALLLLAGQIFLILTSAYWSEDHNGQILLTLFYFVFFCAGGYAMAHTRKWLVSYIALSIGALLFRLSGDHPILWSLHTFCICSALILLFWEILKHSFVKKNVPKMDRVIAGVGGYLLLGLFWAMPLYLVHILTPNSIISLIDEEAISRSEILYFSFVSLTTLGYGDIVPNSPFARVIAMFVSLSGVLYLAIFISALIGSPREPRK